MYLPSNDQEGKPCLFWPVVICCLFVPSQLITTICQVPPISAEYAIFLPSGDTAGYWSLPGSFVSCISSLPSRFMLHTSSFPLLFETKAIFFIEYVTSVDLGTPSDTNFLSIAHPLISRLLVLKTAFTLTSA